MRKSIIHEYINEILFSVSCAVIILYFLFYRRIRNTDLFPRSFWGGDGQ